MKRRFRNQRRQNRTQLTFQRLEPRQLLAGDFVGGHQVETQFPAGENLVVNGDFETVAPGDDNFYQDTDVESWVAFDSATGQQINIWEYDAVYGNVMDLDSTVADFDRVFQDVTTEADTEYVVTFDYRNHPALGSDLTPFTYDFEVWWNGNLEGRFTGGDAWHTGVIKVTASDLATTRLLFCEIQEPGAPGGDGLGALLDNIRVFKATDYGLSNGGFEIDSSVSPGLVDSADVEGWTAFPDSSDDHMMGIDATSSEIAATEGTSYLNLDTTSDQRDIVYRNLQTIPGATYVVTFDMRTDGEATAGADQLRVRWNQDWAGTIHGTEQWETYGLVLTADAAQTQLMFLEPGEDSGEGSGPLIDNVQIFQFVVNDLVVDINGAEAGVDGTAVFVPGAGAKAIAGEITLAHPSGSQLTSATVTLNGAVDGSSEILAIVASRIPQDSGGNDKITVLGYDSATRQLQLTGSATVQEYQNVLRTLSYFNNADQVGTTNRTVTVSISDSALPPADSSAQASIDLSIETDQAAIDDAILQKYIADNNLTVEEVAAGLYAVIDAPGTGQNPTINSTVRVAYEGRFIELNGQNKLVDGAVFDASSESGIVFPLQNVIAGWQLGIPVFKTGGSGMLLISSALAYGQQGSGSSIPPNTVLVFDVNLLAIVS